MATGPSTSQSPYLVGLQPNIRFVSILSTGDQVGNKPDGVTPWVFSGVPDGIGAFDNGDGTITVLVNHEIFPPTVVGGPGANVVREHGAVGAYVSQLVIDQTTLEVLDGFDAANASYRDVDGDGVWTLEPIVMNRLCSADLPDVGAFFYAGADGIEGTGDDVGTQERIFLNGEEFGAEGRAFAFVITGDEARTVWELPALGKFSWENSVASPDSGAKTVVVGLDDSTPGQITVYVGDKQNTGNTVEQAGLSNGILYGIKAAGIGNSLTGNSENQIEQDGNAATVVPMTGAFELVEIPGAATISGAAQETASDALGVTEWWRPEDGAWDTQDGNRFYFVTTAQVGSPSRLWALDFADVADPLAGGTFTMLLQGTEGYVMFDNLTVDADGKVWLVEDPGTFQASAKTWVYDPTTDAVSVIAKHDPSRFGDTLPGGGFVAPTAPFTINEETSGIVDVSDLLGDADTQAFLVDVQAHFPFPGVLAPEVVEGGQLLVMYVDAAVLVGNGRANTLTGSYEAEELFGKGGDDLMLAGSGNDVLRGAVGNDTLVGGVGADTLVGGDGADWFVFNDIADGGDTIRRFAIGEDKIVVSASGFGGGLVEGVLDTEKLAFGTEAELFGSGQFVYNDDTGVLSWDLNGQGGAQSIALAIVTVPITAADILVIA